LPIVAARMPNLKSMSIDKLANLRAQVDAALASRVADERRTLQTQLGQLSRFSAGGTPMLRGRGGVRGAVAPKYRNPDNPSETWAGRGLKPRWLAAALKSGKKLEDFAIDRSAKTASTKRMPRKTRAPKKK
jgi:DNA-binding protein H-NS